MLMTTPSCFFEPVAAEITLTEQPRLASWNASTHPDQIRLNAYLECAANLLLPRLEGLADPLGLRLDVGLPDGVALLAEHDLDNYLFPLATHLSKASGKGWASVVGTKRAGGGSLVGVGRAVPRDYADDTVIAEVTTTVSASTTAFKEEISKQIKDLEELPPGPVRLNIAFTVGPHRAWANVWKPTIDSLDRLLGRTRPDRPWHPLDGRITQLGLHRHEDRELGNSIRMVIAAASTS